MTYYSNMPDFDGSYYATSAVNDDTEVLAAPEKPGPEYSFVKPDAYFHSRRIFKLSVLDFNRFVKLHEKTLVMFYSSGNPSCPLVEHRFAEVANKSWNERYGFASVDCRTDKPVCIRYGGCETPMLKLFSNGYEVSAIRDPTGINVDQINMLMKMTPVLRKSRGDVGRFQAIQNPQLEPQLPRTMDKPPDKPKNFLKGLFKKS